jgi:isopropylmalate/homocitrate/citramalate synthase
VTSTPWKTDRWFSSPWNYLPEVTSGFTFPETLELHDVTLRDGEQQAGVEFTTDDKIRIAELLAAAGVHRIEAGLPAVSKADEKAVREIAKRDLGAKIFAFSRCMIDDVKLAVDCGVAGVVMEIPSSHHLIEKAYRWPLEKALDLSIEATSYAHEHGLTVSFFPIDATRSSAVELLDDLGRVATEGHVDAVGLVDTFGVISPHAVGYFVSQIGNRLGVPLETHFHMDMGLGVANTILAVAMGASCIQTTIAGIGERAGNTPMEETVLALLTMYGLDMGIKTEQFYPMAREVLERAGVTQPSNRPVIGERLFNVESGIIASWVKNVGDEYLTEAFPYRPELVGQKPPEIVLGKGSGLDSVAIWLSRINVTASTPEIEAVLVEVKARSLDTKRTLSEDEFRDIVDRVLPGRGSETVPVGATQGQE